MISPEIKPILGPTVERVQTWIAVSEDGKTLLDAIAHQVALHEAQAVTELTKHPLSRVKVEMPLEAQRNLALAETYRNALEVLQKFSREQSLFITTNLPISHV